MESVKIDGLDNVLRTLQKLPADVVSNKRGGVVLQSLRKGAQVLVKEAKSNLDKISTPDTGLLKKNVVTRRNRKFAGNGEHLKVRVSRKKYPGRKQSQGMPDTTLKVGQILEYGSSRQPARPWFRPAFHSKKNEVVKVATDDLKQRIDKLAKQHLGGA